MLLALVACSTDTPTAPETTPAPPPGSSPGTAWSITISVSPNDLAASDPQPATVTVQVRRADSGSRPQDGTTVVVSAGLGEFNAAASGVQSVTVSLSGGAAQLLYFAGAILGQDTIQARLENSVGSARVNILEAAVPFIQSVTPTSGPQGGGTRIRINGTGFSDPSRVTVGDINAVVDKIGKNSEGEFIRAFTGPVLIAETFFTTEECDTDGDGITAGDGEVYLPKTVDVKVTPASGTEISLANAFTYLPGDSSCRDVNPDPPPPNRPKAKFSFTKNNLTVLFNNESTPDGLTFQWVFGDGTAISSTTSPIHTYALAGSYEVTLRATNISGISTVTQTVTVP